MSEANQVEDRSDVEERDPHADEIKLVRNRAGVSRRAKTASRELMELVVEE
jgi:NACalpha-BTF3-like transcription factor